MILKPVVIKVATVFIIFIAIFFRAAILFRDTSTSLCGDEAVFALMAKYIIELKEFPIYMWLNHFGGTIVSYLAAISFLIFGVSVNSFRIIGIFISFSWVILMYKLAKKMFGKEVGLLTGLFTLLPSSFILDFSRLTVGIYAEGLFFTTTIFLFLNNCLTKNSLKEYLLLGLFLGLGLWTTPLVFPAFVTVLIILIIKRLLSKFHLLFIGFFIGYLPAIIYNLKYPTATLYRVAGRILNLDRSVLSYPTQKIIETIFNRMLWKLSIIPQKIINIPELFLPIIGVENLNIIGMIVISIFIVVIFKMLKPGKIITGGFLTIYTFVFLVFYCFLVEPERARYLIPLIIPLVIFLARFLSDIRKRYEVVFWVVTILIITHNIYGNMMTKKTVKRYDKLANFLLSKNIFYCFSDYWVAYPVIFNTKEKVIISPTVFDTLYDRRPHYTEVVRKSNSTAYIFDTIMYKNMIKKFETKLSKLGIFYKKEFINEFAIYYDFNRKFFPEEIQLNE